MTTPRRRYVLTEPPEPNAYDYEAAKAALAVPPYQVSPLQHVARLFAEERERALAPLDLYVARLRGPLPLNLPVEGTAAAEEIADELAALLKDARR